MNYFNELQERVRDIRIRSSIVYHCTLALLMTFTGLFYYRIILFYQPRAVCKTKLMVKFQNHLQFFAHWLQGIL